MGTHPIFESDFDCLEEKASETRVKKLKSNPSRQSQLRGNCSKITIHEDPVLEALCEKTKIEPRTSIKKRGISVTQKERKKLFNQFTSASDIEDLFADENKLREFITEVTGSSARDKEINEEITQMKKRYSQDSIRRSNSRTSIGRSISMSSRTSNHSNYSRNPHGEVPVNYEAVKEILQQHRARLKKDGPKLDTQAPIKGVAPKKDNLKHSVVNERTCEVAEEATKEINNA